MTPPLVVTDPENEPLADTVKLLPTVKLFPTLKAPEKLPVLPARGANKAMPVAPMPISTLLPLSTPIIWIQPLFAPFRA